LRLSGSATVPAAPQRVFELLLDPAVLSRCLPGCQGLERIGEDEYRMRMKAMIGAISGAFDGTVRLTDRQFPESFRMAVEGAGRAGFVKGEGLLKLTEKDGGTEVAYDGELQAGGMIASVGQRLLDTTARMMIRRFFTRLSEEAGRRQRRLNGREQNP